MVSPKNRMILICWTAFCLAAVFCTGCSNEKKPGKDQIVAKINTFVLTRDDYESKLATELEYDLQYKATVKAKRTFLDALIRKEILVQEAVRQGMDRQKPFMAAIEKYWEATLIKNLMEKKMADLRRKTIVTEQEIKKRYIRLKNKNENLPPLPDIEKKISDTLKEEKMATRIETWIRDLKDKADITINQSYIGEETDK